MPGRHGTHSAAPARPLTLLNVPTGHGFSTPVATPAGQKYPGGQVAGNVVFTPQKARAGQVVHVTAPVTSV